MSLLSIKRGDRKLFDITLVDGDDQPLDLTGLTLRFVAKRSLNDADSAAVVSKDDTDGIVVDADPTTGLAVLTLEPEDTEEIADEPTLVWDLQVDNGAGDVQTAVTGLLAVERDVTREA